MGGQRPWQCVASAGVWAIRAATDATDATVRCWRRYANGAAAQHAAVARPWPASTASFPSLSMLRGARRCALHRQLSAPWRREDLRAQHQVRRLKRSAREGWGGRRGLAPAGGGHAKAGTQDYVGGAASWLRRRGGIHCRRGGEHDTGRAPSRRSLVVVVVNNEAAAARRRRRRGGRRQHGGGARAQAVLALLGLGGVALGAGAALPLAAARGRRGHGRH